MPSGTMDSVRTERLLLRRPVASDLAAVVAVHADPETNRFNPRGPSPPEACRGMLEAWLEHWASHGFGYWTVARRDEPEEIVGFGGVMLKEIREEVCPNLYVRFRPTAWGRGYATEVGLAAVRAAIRELGFARVRAVVRLSNLPSRRVLERLGMNQIAEQADGEPGHELSAVYEIRREGLEVEV